MSLAAYRPIVRTPGVPSLFAAAIVARMPIGFESLAIVLVVREVSGSFTVAGIAVACAFAVVAVTSAPLGRLVDRFGQRRVLWPTSLVNVVAVCLLAAAGLAESSNALLIGCAALTGIAPPVSSAQRTIIAGLFAGESLRTAYTLEAIVQEAVFIGGPLLATLAVTLSGPPAALFVAAGFQLVGTSWFVNAKLSRAWRPTVVDRSRRTALGTPAVRVLALYGGVLVASFGAFEVATTAFARAEGSAGLAGLLLAVWAFGSAVGGVTFGALGHPTGGRMGVIALVCAVGFIPTAFAPNLWAMVPLMLIAGVMIAPAVGLLYTLTGELAPEGMLTEAFAWLTVAVQLGAGAGAALAGAIADGPGTRVALGISGVGAFLAGLVALKWRGTLAPSQAGRSLDAAAGSSPEVG